MSEISLEVLNKEEQEELFKLSPFFKGGGYLAGGTALMLQLYFRRSYDFDLFFGYEIPEMFLRNASEIYIINGTQVKPRTSVRRFSLIETNFLNLLNLPQIISKFGFFISTL